MQRRSHDRRPRGRGVVPASLIAIVLALGTLSACGGGGGGDPTVLRAGQLDIKLPQGYKVVHGKIAAPASTPSSAAAAATSASGSSGGTAAPGAGTGTTIPLNSKQDPTKTLFTAIGQFRSCLDGLGVKFIGAPNSADPSSPTNDPNYIKSLSTCAARSNIVQALQASQSANNNLSPAEIKKRNKGYLLWRSCMIDRGWKIAKPVPDSQGRLFAFGGSGGGGGGGGGGGAGGSGGTQSQIQAPPGKDVLSSTDVQECATKSQKAIGQ